MLIDNESSFRDVIHVSVSALFLGIPSGVRGTPGGNGGNPEHCSTSAFEAIKARSFGVENVPLMSREKNRFSISN